MGRIPDAVEADANRAVEAAAHAFETWGQASARERRALLMKLREGLSARVDELGEIMAGEVGKPLAMSKNIQAGLPLVSIDNFIRILADHSFEERIENSLVVKEPVRVVAAITPWNYPLHQIMAKICPALAAGCTLIVKPSEVAPLAAFVLAEEVHRAGQVVINGGGFNMMAPFGGYKQSGHGREHGPYALDEYLQTKSLQM
jgi:betaine-aldehyde dehydrogenase